jgi:hypothetical protein
MPILPSPNTKMYEEGEKNIMKRAEANDPVALIERGKRHYHKGKCNVAIEYWTKAAELDDIDADAHFLLSSVVLGEFGYSAHPSICTPRVEKDEKTSFAGHTDAK